MTTSHRRPYRHLASSVGALAVALLGATAAQAQQTVTMWSHWPDEASKRNFVEGQVKAFEAATPSCKVNLQFIQKADRYTSAKTAVRTGQAPDIFWLEPDEIAFAKSGYLEPLDAYVDLNNLEDRARRSWSVNGQVYGLPLEAYTVELYYNRDLLKKIGANAPASMQFTQAEFTEMVKKAAAAGITPLAQGVGDRPYPGAYFLQEMLLRKLGTDDYALLLTGKLAFQDQRVIEAMTWVKQLVDAGAYPKSFATLKLGESHGYFHTNPGALMFHIASWYTGRAFVDPAKGGQPAAFPLGLMKYPVPTGAKCPECKTLAVGGSYVMFSKSKSKECAGKLLSSFANIEAGNKWMEGVLLQTGIKTDPSRIKSIYAPGARLMVHENWRFRTYYRQAAAWLHSARIGRVLQAQMTLLSAGLLPDAQGQQPVLVRQPFIATLQRALVMEVLIHHIDTLRFLLGEMQVAHAHLGRSSPAMVGEDHATLGFETSAGASVLLLANLAVHGEAPALADRLLIIGERGSIRLQGDTLSCDGDVPATQRYEMPQCCAGAYADTISHFIDALNAGTSFETSPQDNLRTLKLVEDIYTPRPR